MQFSIEPKILMYQNCSKFCEEMKIGKDDLIITSGHIYENNLKGNVEGASIINLRKYGNGEPNDQMVEAIKKDISDLPYQRVIAIGGGTILDVAKIFVLKNMTPVIDLFEKKIPLEKEKELILVPTTCGTGSEVTNISILEFITKKTKFGLAADVLFADYAVLVPELLDSLPYKSFAASTMDAFIHAIESYLSPKANPMTQLFSKQAMEMIIRGYQLIRQDGEEARKQYLEKFMIASTYAGIAFGNAGCAAVHALSYPLGAVFHIAHGESNYAMFLGVFRRYQMLKPEGKLQELNEFLSDLLSCPEENTYEELELLFDFILKRKTLGSYGVAKSQLDEFTDSVLKNQGRLMANNYTELSRDDVYEIYLSVYDK